MPQDTSSPRMNYKRQLNNDNIKPIPDTKSEVMEEQRNTHNEGQADVTEELQFDPI
jgi:hypothetical protein